jgi:DnaK suppressor protein
MNGLDENQLGLLRAALERRRAELLGSDHVEMSATHELPVQEVETSPADKATVRLLNDLAVGAAGHNVAQLAAIKHALAKFDDGTYGECEECGNQIGFSRLQARPEATLCIACQTRAERR